MKMNASMLTGMRKTDETVVRAPPLLEAIPLPDRLVSCGYVAIQIKKLRVSRRAVECITCFTPR